MSTNFDAQNRKVFERGLKLHLNNVVKPKLLSLLTGIAEEFVNYIDSIPDNSPIPIYSGNLKDSTGVGVYVDGVAKVFIPTKTSEDKQYMKERGTNKRVFDIDGMDDLIYEVLSSTSRFSEGIWFVVFSAVPYAWYVNEYGSPSKSLNGWVITRGNRGQGFFDDIQGKARQMIIDGLRTEGIEFR